MIRKMKATCPVIYTGKDSRGHPPLELLDQPFDNYVHISCGVHIDLSALKLVRFCVFRSREELHYTRLKWLTTYRLPMFNLYNHSDVLVWDCWEVKNSVNNSIGMHLIYADP